MTQTSSRFCTNCRASIASNMQFCPNCGAPASGDTDAPTYAPSSGGTPPQPPRGATQGGNAPPPSYVTQSPSGAYSSGQGTYTPPPSNATQRQPQSGIHPSGPGTNTSPPSYTTYPQQQSGGFSSPSTGPQHYQPGVAGHNTHNYQPQQPPAPPHFQPRKRASRVGIGAGLLLLILVLGVGGYFVWNIIGKPNGTGTNQGTTQKPEEVANNTPTTDGNETTTTVPGDEPATNSNGQVITLNKTITYADDTITIISVEQAQGFPDETKPGEMLRLNIKEETGSKPPYFGTYGYFSGVHVILPNGDSVELANARTTDLPADVSRENWWDFAVPVTTPAHQIVLRLGLPTEHQIDVPLKADADVSKYQARTASPNKEVGYGGLNWTLTSASWQLSAEGVQADKGMCYIVLSLSVDSPSTNGYLSQAVSDAFRLKTDDGTTTASKYNTFPMTIAAGETDKEGTVGFLVPQESTSFTLIMPVYDRGGVVSAVEVKTDFQIP